MNNTNKIQTKFFLCLIISLIFSCQSKVICPAYQSVYILDDSVRNTYFSSIWLLDEATRQAFLSGRTKSTYDADSSDISNSSSSDYYAYLRNKRIKRKSPKKNKSGIVSQPVLGFVKNERLKTVPMQNILHPSPKIVYQDTIDEIRIDTIQDDSTVFAANQTKESQETERYFFRYDPSDNFNVEQEYYNKHYGELLIDHTPIDSTLNSRKKIIDFAAIGEFFANLFKKKDTLVIQQSEVPIDSLDFENDNFEFTEENDFFDK